MPNVEIKDYQTFEYLWRHNGLSLEDGQRYKIEDALSVPDAQHFLPRVVEEIVREAVEPLLVGAKLLDRIEYKYGQTISFPSMGTIYAADIPEGGEYPERKLQVGPGIVIATIGKSGVAIKITDEMRRYSQYDVVNLHLRHAGFALARHKEKKVWAMFSKEGVTTHDNLNPSGAYYGTTTGRDFDGNPNGSVTMDDIFEAYGMVLTNGFNPNTIIVHPLTWVMWVRDPILRAFALNASGGTYFATWQGNPAAQNPWSNGQMGKMGPSPNKRIDPNNSPLSDYPNNINAGPKLPSYFPFPLRLFVSPFVPYNPQTKLTNIYIVDSMNVGALIVDEDPTTEEIPDRLRDMTKIKIRERYALAPYNDGNAIAVIRNVKVVPNEIVLPQTSMITGLTAIDRSNAIT